MAAVGFVQAFVPIAIGLTTTALGTLLPILRDNQMLEGRFGGYIMAAGAVGEFLPIVAIAVFLSTTGAFLGLISLVVMGGIALLFTFVPRLVRNKRVAGILAAGEHATSQTTLRWTMFLLCALLVIAADFGLDVVLGAFLAGRGPAPLGARRRARLGSQARRGRATGSSFRSSSCRSGMNLDIEVDRGVTAPAVRLLRSCSSRSVASRPCCSIGTTCPCAAGYRWCC